MSDLIKREDAIATIGVMYERCDTYDITDYRDLMLEAVKVLPSADRPQGEWIEKNNGYNTTCECSVCHYRNFIPNYQVGSKYVCMDRYWFKRNYCPNCGADMRKGADDE